MNINLTLLGQMGTFLVLVWVTMKYIWPPLMQAMDERAKRIADGLAAAERGQHDQEEAERRVAELIKDAKGQASEIVSNAEKRGSQIVEEARDHAKTEGERLLVSAQAQLEQEVNRARETLRGQVASLAVAGASRVLGREIDSKSHAGLIDDLVAEL